MMKHPSFLLLLCLSVAPLVHSFVAPGRTSSHVLPPSLSLKTRESLSSQSKRWSAVSDYSDFMDDYFHPYPDESSLHRMRRRKAAILSKKKNMKTGYFFAMWYALSIVYNIYSKKALNLAPSLSWTSAWIQMATGLAYVWPLWTMGIRKKPRVSKPEAMRMLPVAFLHSLVHIGGVVSMGAGAVSFTYIVKASEPAVSAVMTAMMGHLLPLSCYLTLLPVIGGVALASVSELSFTWKSFNYAMMSNIASSSRGIVAKKTMGGRIGQNMTPANLYAVMTIMCTLLIAPLTIAAEGQNIIPAFKALRASGQLPQFLIWNLLAGLFYYTYNEVSFLCLKNVSPVSHAIGNTLKRVFIIVSSLILFGTPMTFRGVVGSSVAVLGVLWYSLEKQKQLEKAKTNKY